MANLFAHLFRTSLPPRSVAAAAEAPPLTSREPHRRPLACATLSVGVDDHKHRRPGSPYRTTTRRLGPNIPSTRPRSSGDGGGNGPLHTGPEGNDDDDDAWAESPFLFMYGLPEDAVRLVTAPVRLASYLCRSAARGWSVLRARVLAAQVLSGLGPEERAATEGRLASLGARRRLEVLARLREEQKKRRQ